MITIKKKSFLLFGILMCFVMSCVTQKDLEYFRNGDKTIKSYKESDVPNYKVKPNDELYIQIYSLDDPTANMFNNASNQQSSNTMSTTPYGASLISYVINKEGYLQLPVIGNMYVKDKTTSEISLILTDSLAHILSQPVVTVKLVNRYVSVLGEVRVPGHYAYSQEKLSVLDAIGIAGDITVYGNRKSVILARNEKDQNYIVHLDLTNQEILASEYYYIRPNDIIYVKPLKKRFWGMNEFPFAILLSTLSVTLLFYSVIK
jgi:polysaccharide export outer membrane protein